MTTIREKYSKFAEHPKSSTLSPTNSTKIKTDSISVKPQIKSAKAPYKEPRKLGDVLKLQSSTSSLGAPNSKSNAKINSNASISSTNSQESNRRHENVSSLSKSSAGMAWTSANDLVKRDVHEANPTTDFGHSEDDTMSSSESDSDDGSHSSWVQETKATNLYTIQYPGTSTKSLSSLDKGNQISSTHLLSGDSSKSNSTTQKSRWASFVEQERIRRALEKTAIRSGEQVSLSMNHISEDQFKDKFKECRSESSLSERNDSELAYRVRPGSVCWRSSTLATSPLPLPCVEEPIPKPIWPFGEKDIVPAPEFRFVERIPAEFYADTNPMRSFTSLKPELPPEPNVVYDCEWKLNSPGLAIHEDSLIFESRFEGGNLGRAIKLNEFEYELHLRQDTSTRGHTQWFFFRIQNVNSNTTYRFHISNLMKRNSLYESGLKPLFYSEHLSNIDGVGWHRSGFNISYTENPLEEGCSRPKYTLSFSVQFPVNQDTVYLAHCYPYTYSYWQKYLADLKHDALLADRFRHRILCKSLAGNNVDLLTITKKVSSPEELQDRPAIILISRIHPGETNSSWMMHGLLDYLLGDDPQAEALRARFVIKVVPMINPDGVILGNYRCNLAGYDLNRRWNMSERGASTAPEIYHVRNMICQTAEARPVIFSMDLHGHNRKHGVFIYGCPHDSNPNRIWAERVFPFMLSREEPDMFHFRRCQFRIERKKEGTGRITFWRKFNLMNSFTVEASFCGSDFTPAPFHYNIDHLKRMGRSLGITISRYFDADDPTMNPTELCAGPDGIVCGRKARDIYHLIKTQLLRRDSMLQPDQSDSSDTTSDDEALRIPMKKRKSISKRPSSAPLQRTKSTPLSRPSSSLARSTAPKDVKTQAQDFRPPSRPNSAISSRPSSPSARSDTATSSTFEEKYKIKRIPYNPPSVQLSNMILSSPYNGQHQHRLYLARMHSGFRSECSLGHNHSPSRRCEGRHDHLELQKQATSRAFEMRRKQFPFH